MLSISVPDYELEHPTKFVLLEHPIKFVLLELLFNFHFTNSSKKIVVSKFYRFFIKILSPTFSHRSITYRKKSQNFFPITKPNVQKHKRMPWLYNPMYGKKLKTSLADREATHLRCFHVRILLHDARNNDGKPSACINSTVKFK